MSIGRLGINYDTQPKPSKFFYNGLTLKQLFLGPLVFTWYGTSLEGLF